MFGAALPALAPLLIDYADARTGLLVPAQTWFGPATFLGYRWLRRRYGRERSMKEYLAAANAPALAAAVPEAAPAPTPVPVSH